MSSPCSPCENCGKYKKPFYYDQNHYHKPLKCSSKICKLVDANVCTDKELTAINKKKKICSFYKERHGESIKGYYLRDIVYFEIDRKKILIQLYSKKKNLDHMIYQ